MELNRAQLLVQDDDTLNKFRINHCIPKDVQIEHPRPNKDANLVEGHGDRIPVRTLLLHQAGLRFPINSMVKELMAYCHLTFIQVSVTSSELCSGLGTMTFGHSRGTMVVYLTISMTNSNSYLKIARKSFKPLTTSKLQGSQVPLPSPNLVLALVAHEGVEPSSSKAPFLDKFKMKVFAADPSKKSKMKASRTSSAYLPSSSLNAKFWKPKFSTVELTNRARCPSKYPTWSAPPSVVEPVDPPQAYSLLVLPGFNEEKILEEEADKVLEKVPEVAE
ncbi:hypothetical protein Acr_11g0008290 [Actinidia rufa]|uniref:Uncharacterized protein n=1 Tax=Actinidia rufa TaxID=165716 RepID=A0A7J0FD77_9ERIC|nr:hypothetical protein Acr_11g0008290 [Actinidia rufa]